jgi:hypothetical protein
MPPAAGSADRCREVAGPMGAWAGPMALVGLLCPRDGESKTDKNETLSGQGARACESGQSATS